MNDERSATPSIDRWLDDSDKKSMPLPEQVERLDRQVEALQAELAAMKQFAFALFDKVPSQRRAVFERYCDLYERASAEGPHKGDRNFLHIARRLEQEFAAR